VIKGHCWFDFEPTADNKDDECPLGPKNKPRHGQRAEFVFDKEFVTKPIVTYSVTSYTMEENEHEHEHSSKKEPPHFDYALHVMHTTTEKVVFRLASATAAKRISATVTLWAMGVRLN